MYIFLMKEEYVWRMKDFNLSRYSGQVQTKLLRQLLVFIGLYDFQALISLYFAMRHTFALLGLMSFISTAMINNYN